MACDVLERFDPKLAKLIEPLLKGESIGICGDRIRISEPKTGLPQPLLTSARVCDRFKLHIPFAGRTLKWEVIFNHNQPSYPPDFIFGSHDCDFFPDIEKMESLWCWDANDSESFVSVVKELIAQYKQHQSNQVAKLPRMQFEYAFLKQHPNDFPDFEMHVVKGNQDMGNKVNFMIKLPIDLSDIPPYLIKDCPGEDVACLLVSYQSPDAEHVVPTVFLSPRVERALGGVSSLRIPQWGDISGACLLDYVPNVVQLLTSKVEQVRTSYNKRSAFISSFLVAFYSSVLEYDAEGFTKISFLLQVHGFGCIVQFQLSKRFPDEKPVLILQSIYHACNGAPFESRDTSLPYSPRWSTDVMAERARKTMKVNERGPGAATVTRHFATIDVTAGGEFKLKEGIPVGGDTKIQANFGGGGQVLALDLIKDTK